MEQKTDWKAIRSLVYSKVYIPSVFSEVLGITFDPRRRFINPLHPSKTADSGFFRDKKNTDKLTFAAPVIWLGNTYCFVDELTELGFTNPS